ncbi:MULTISPECIES: M24 family metallopeptidase [unclassified Beijerinckia]|uniref:M24 family metallopeptidase n=1 Tax=unclassified Beijerinckia TaxID=2638183 RepID=UPI00089BF200|nr:MULTISPECIES: M24 family metallopeptidase [unclassified Beijerinckia]MDH7798907.1 Xaa-Pro dipeptidase [Beijerinckia sp. GAS462]SED87337.1 Xaa-Pro aminopeptidase [Beijerinckia sp. 28-YEA-48]
MPNIDVPRFSMAERDRRWARVRELMARDGMDVIVATPHTGHHDHFSAYSRYLTGLGGYSLEVGAVFPLDGTVTAIVVPDVAPRKWHAQQDWVTDIRSHGRAFGDGIITRLKELGLDRSRIGLAGLTGVPRFADGLVTHAFYEKLRQAFPNAVLCDCTRLLDVARYTKGPEEIEFLRGGVVQAEAAIAALQATARPGISENEVYAAMLAAMVARGSEVPAMIMWSAGRPEALVSAGLPTARRFEPGDFIRVEVESRYAGYCGQVTQMAVLGQIPPGYNDLWQLQQEAVALCSEWAKPGITLGELATRTEAIAKNTPCRIRFLMHGRGLGDDAPIYVFSAADEIKRWVLEENASFIIKPMVIRDGYADVVWGDSVMITLAGAQRLGTIEPTILELS